MKAASSLAWSSRYSRVDSARLRKLLVSPVRAAPAAATAAPAVTARPLRTEPTFSSLPDALSVLSAASSISSPNLSVCWAASRISLPMESMACWFWSSSRCISFRAASALFSWICHCWVRRSFSPKEADAFSSALRRVSIFFFWASISLPSTWFRAVRASTESSFLSNWD